MSTTIKIPVIPPGTDLKFRVTVTKENFSLDGAPFNVVIKNRWGRVVARVLSGDCYQDSEGKWYFNVENAQEGEHYAVFIGVIADADYGKGQRMWHDRQMLFIGHDGCCAAEGRPMPKPEGCPVLYEQVWTVNLGDGEYLADRDGNYIYTSDGKRISFSDRSTDDGKVRLSMTGDEFLKLIEGREPNSEVNTIPEMMDAMRGISDDKTIIDEIDEQQEENEADDSDIDEIFEQSGQTGGSGGFLDEMGVEEGD